MTLKFCCVNLAYVSDGFSPCKKAGKGDNRSYDLTETLHEKNDAHSFFCHL